MRSSHAPLDLRVIRPLSHIQMAPNLPFYSFVVHFAKWSPLLATLAGQMENIVRTIMLLRKVANCNDESFPKSVKGVQYPLNRARPCCTSETCG